MGNGSTFGTDSGVGSTIALLKAQLPAVRERRSRAEAELAAVTAEEEAITKALEGLRLLSGTLLDGPGEPSTEVTAAPEEAVQDAGAAAEPVQEQAPPSPEGPAAAAAGAKKRAAAKKAPARKAGAAKKATPARGKQAPVSGAKKAAGKASADTGPKAAAKRVPTARKTAPAAPAGPAGGKPPIDASAPQAGRRRKVADADSVLEVLSQAGGPLRAREVTERLGLEALEGNINAVRTRLERLAKDARAQRTGRGLYTVVDGRAGS
ncbi:hypothetical protein [Streptomyces sp. CB01881]|uniref:hypothetical protein n=1 Tax=Streptomyces sp. CB01881 TaxID=2078691 RepID=UPI0011E03AFB|nr:hypothetical protein [Streptomyces sp. CB01881]TYC68643.1 hypothetical protein EH183_37785 [Streptomyces sp. CB01881]